MQAASANVAGQLGSIVAGGLILTGSMAVVAWLRKEKGYLP